MLGQITFQNLYFCVLFNYPEIYNKQLLTEYVKKKKKNLTNAPSTWNIM